MEYISRIKNVQNQLEEQGIDAFISFTDVNYAYLTGFTGSSGCVIVTQNKALLMTDSRYIAQSKQQTQESGVELHIHKAPLLGEVSELLLALGAKKIGFESDRIIFANLKVLESSAYELVPQLRFIESIREIKDAKEIEALKVAIKVIEDVYKEMLTYVKPGMTEVEVAMRMEMHMRQLGASGPSFDTIFASGVRGALPHGAASDKIIESGELITVDFGAIVNGYCSDMTRTFALGTPKNEQLVEIYNIVLKAQQTSTKAIKAGLTGQAIDKIARDIIIESGFGDYFGHSLGHSVGMEVHELPGLSASSMRVLEEGMIVTTEPGIYIEDLGGVRIEDMVLVKENGFENLMTLPKELIVV